MTCVLINLTYRSCANLGSLKAEPEIRICMPGLHLGSEGNPRRESGREGREEGKTAKRVCTLHLWLLGGRMGEGIVREFGMNMYPLLYLKWITNKDLLYSTGNSAQYSATS